MLGLRQQVGGKPFGIVVLVGDHQHLRRPGDGVDADHAEHLALGGGDVGIAGPDDLGDRCAPSRCHRPARPRPGRRRCGRSRRRRPGARPPAPADSSPRPATARPWRCAARRRPGPARRSSAPSSDSWRGRRAHRGRPIRPPSSASPARHRARRCSGRRRGSWRWWWLSMRDRASSSAAIVCLVAGRDRRGDLRLARRGCRPCGEVEPIETRVSSISARIAVAGARRR